MSRLIVFGAAGSVGSHVLQQALAAGHEVTGFVRSAAGMPLAETQVSVYHGDLNAMAPYDIAQLIRGHDALINCAGHVSDGPLFVNLIDRLVTAVESLPIASRPVCWFIAGAALLDIDDLGRRAVELPKIKSTYWPHQVNFDRLRRSDVDWRLLCPGPMIDDPALGLPRLRLSLDTLPVDVPPFTSTLPDALLLPIFGSLIPQMTVPYGDAAACMLANLGPDDMVCGHRVGIALPIGMEKRKSEKRPQLEGR